MVIFPNHLTFQILLKFFFQPQSVKDRKNQTPSYKYINCASAIEILVPSGFQFPLAQQTAPVYVMNCLIIPLLYKFKDYIDHIVELDFYQFFVIF